MNRWRVPTVVVAAVVFASALATLAGCSGDPTKGTGEEAQQEYLPGPSAAVSEYEARTTTLILPEGVVWPEGLGPNRDANGNVQDEPVLKGAGSTMADLYWVCAWRWEALTQHDKDPARAQRALETLQQLKQMRFYLELTDRGGYYREFEEAALGDLTRMRSIFDATCGYLAFNESSS